MMIFLSQFKKISHAELCDAIISADENVICLIFNVLIPIFDE